jgi:hypothetical protein
VGPQGIEGDIEACLRMSAGSVSCQNMVTSSGSLVTVGFMDSEDADTLASEGSSCPFLSLKLVISVSLCVGRVKVKE